MAFPSSSKKDTDAIHTNTLEPNKQVVVEMKNNAVHIGLKKAGCRRAFLVALGLIVMGCSSTKKNGKASAPLTGQQDVEQVHGEYGTMSPAFEDYTFDDHVYIRQAPAPKTLAPAKAKDSMAQVDKSSAENEIHLQAVLQAARLDSINLAIKSPVADRIVENYLNSKNKEPDGHCLAVSRGRFEKAYREVHGHLPYQDLPDSMGTKLYTPVQVFLMLYVSASDKSRGWRNLPEAYRGKGNAGAIAYAGMGTLIDSSAIWGGQLRPGALMQVWRYKYDYEKVVEGANVKKLDPYGHSFIFIRYVRDEENVITGLQIADQGFQSYRPLLPRDYEVWWAVNLSI